MIGDELLLPGFSGQVLVVVKHKLSFYAKLCLKSH
jgi:hypothetical protein